MGQEAIIWTQKEKRKLSDTYFKILQITEKYYELQSKNTGHHWIVKKICTGKYPVVLYHKHSRKNTYYHKQCGVYTVTQAINEIKKHDQYIQCHLNK